jgi:uncharacterized Zn-finger protein
MSGSGYLKFRNDRGVPEICIGVREFECIGVSPPQGHPHVYINMGEADTILVVGQSNWAQFTADEATVWVNRLGNQAGMRVSDNFDLQSSGFANKREIYRTRVMC